MSNDIKTIPSGFNSENDIKVFIHTHYIHQINNYFGDKQKALKFLSGVMAALQRTPELIKCTPVTLINSFMTMAQLGFMPSSVSGEAYVIPYKNKGILEAQFQIGYQGIVTLLYSAGNKEVISELVRDKDVFSISRGKIVHEVDPRKSKTERGDWIGVYAIITTPAGGSVEQYMSKTDVMAHAKRFSKSFSSDFSPWNEKNDPEGWMPRKTILKQTAKLAPKNEALSKAIAEDNKDSVIGDRLEGAQNSAKSLTMGALIKNNEQNKKENNAEGQDKTILAQGAEAEDYPDIV